MQKPTTQKGQALAQFAITLPVLLFVTLGMIDFGRYLFTYAHSFTALREAVRGSKVVGATDNLLFTYLDCAAINETATNIPFAKNVSVSIEYVTTDSHTPQVYTCENVTDRVLHSGDLLRVSQVVTIEPLFFPIGDLTLNFAGQRTIVKVADLDTQTADQVILTSVD